MTPVHCSARLCRHCTGIQSAVGHPIPFSSALWMQASQRIAHVELFPGAEGAPCATGGAVDDCCCPHMRMLACGLCTVQHLRAGGQRFLRREPAVHVMVPLLCQVWAFLGRGVMRRQVRPDCIALLSTFEAAHPPSPVADTLLPLKGSACSWHFHRAMKQLPLVNSSGLRPLFMSGLVCHCWASRGLRAANPLHTHTCLPAQKGQPDPCARSHTRACACSAVCYPVTLAPLLDCPTL